MHLAPLPLTASEITTLEAAAAKGPHPRMRRRAQAVLGHHRGATLHQLAALFAVGYNTVGLWLRHGQEQGLAGLAEGQRAGRPAKLPPVVKKVVAWLGPATQPLRAWLPAIRRAWGMRVSLRTLRRMARRAGYRWKRCRRSPRGQRDAALFAAARQHLGARHRAEARGEVALVYVDECRFSRQAPVPYAWQRRGPPPEGLPAIRGRGGHSVLGFWQAQAPGQPLQACLREGSPTADLFVLAANDFGQTLRGPPCSCSTMPPFTKPASCARAKPGGRRLA